MNESTLVWREREGQGRGDKRGRRPTTEGNVNVIHTSVRVPTGGDSAAPSHHHTIVSAELVSHTTPFHTSDLDAAMSSEAAESAAP